MNYILLLALPFVVATAHAHISDPNRSCLREMRLGPEFAEDEFYQPMRMLGGRYKGECVDNRMRRSIRLFSIKSAEDREWMREYGINMKPGYSYFANFKHHNHYFIAEYPNGSIASTTLVFEKFMELGGGKFQGLEDENKERAITGIVLSGHIQLRFKLKKGYYINLYPQYRGGFKKQRVNDFGYALFAVRPMSTSGKKFDPLGDGLNKGYINSMNFMSTYDTALSYKKYMAAGSTVVGQFAIEDSHFDAEDAMQALLKASDKDYRRDKPVYYHTWLRNCVTSAYIGIDAGAKNLDPLARLIGLGANIVRPAKTIGTGGREWNPLFVLPNLERRGVIKNRAFSEKITLNEETCHILKGEDYREIAGRCR